MAGSADPLKPSNPAEFAHVLDTPAGQTGELVALAQLLQVAGRGGHPDLAPHLGRRAEHLTGTPVPVP
ncbi:hypothetical protein ACRWOO_04590 [Streptomyces sp. NEAU-PBA10]|uniref:Uncharacterized protein n=1 Tax=Streptomyces tremellae TaxID=1124239 RepID=A0ABP7DXQ4_9ACTN